MLTICVCVGHFRYVFNELGNPKELIIATFTITNHDIVSYHLFYILSTIVGVVALAFLNLVKCRDSTSGNGELTTLITVDEPV